LTIEDFLLNFVATLGGVFIAFFLTLEYDRRKKSAAEREKRKSALILENEEQKRVITALDLELEANFKYLDSFRQGFNERTVPLLLFRTAAYQSAIDGGTFSKLKPKIQTALANNYDVGFRWIETVGAKLMGMLGTETAFQNWPKYKDRVYQMFADGMSQLHQEIPQSRELLKKELTRFA
jgi:hypothetical protein